MGDRTGDTGRGGFRGRRSTALFILAGVLALSGPAVYRADAQPEASIVFQPAFHQALRWTAWSSRVTYRMKVPLGRAGSRVRVSFRAGEGALQLHAATIALAGPEGSLASKPVALTFAGARRFTAAPGQRLTSDPVELPVTFGAEVAVSFEVEGALATSAIQNFPGSYVRSGGHTTVEGPLGGYESPRAIGLDTIDVEGPPGRAFVALGDSITEGYATGDDDYRASWPAVAQALLRMPVANAAVSGQGIYQAIVALDAEVLTLQGVTDCLVAVGTNDLGALDTPELVSRLETLFTRLRPFCRIWVGTLVPKERTTHGDFEEVRVRRQEVNQWLRTRARVVGVIDFDAVLRRPDAPDRFLEGMGQDGIHPSVAGLKRMGEEAARVLAQTPILTLTGTRPMAGPVGGGNTVTLVGAGFEPGTTVTFGGLPATDIHVTGPDTLVAVAPAHAAGKVDVVAETPDGQRAMLAGGYAYGDELTLRSAQPGAGPVDGGTVITLEGSGLQPGASVFLGGIEVADVSVPGPTSLSFTAPPHGPGEVDIEVRNPDGQMATLRSGFRYLSQPAPRPAGVKPSSGPVSGGTTVTITGTGFEPGATVSFGGTAAPWVAFSYPGLLRVIAPARVPGTVDVVVRNPDGGSGMLVGAFTYEEGSEAPLLTDVEYRSRTCASTSAPLSSGALLAVAVLLARWLPGRARRAR